MASGIAPAVLLAQVQNTASWALEPDASDERASEGPADEWREVLRNAPALEAVWQTPEARRDYLVLLLAAHFATVGTFVPTDVDTRIRHHAWYELHGREALAASVALLDRLEAWDPRAVSARVLATAEGGLLSGHDGEWLAVRAGALGRALAVHADDVADALVERIDAELSREARALDAAVTAPRARERTALETATVIAHNTGDLSRVIEAWPVRSARARELTARFARLGHTDASRYGGAMHLAGHLNKAVMAVENHRFLPLRSARGLRRARALLLPIGPFFDAWGETLGRHRALEPRDRAEALAALLEGHEGDPAQQGYLRAIAGMHRAHAGGIDALTREVPARLRKLAAAGAVRDALRLDEARFEARVANRYRAALGAYRRE